MRIACYSFVRRNSVEGDMSSNRSSTDATRALNDWLDSQPERTYKVQLDNHKSFVAELSWSEADDSAESDLNGACHRFGVDRSYLPTP